MDIAKARTIVRTLAEGIDPTTGELFKETSPFNQPQVIRALYAVHDASIRGRTPARSPEQRRQDNLEAGRPRNCGLRWTDEDRQKVATQFGEGVEIRTIAQETERTEYAIEAELARQGLIEVNADFSGRRR